MWTPRISQLDPHRLSITLVHNTQALSYAQILNLWCDDAPFRVMFTKLLADLPFTAFRWETPALTPATAGRAFECVVLDSPGLARAQDPHTFSEHFDSAPDNAIITCANLGHDAILVIPRPLASSCAYGHLAAFARHAPQPQQHLLWSTLGATMKKRLGTKPVWLNTAGAGVAWLHLRLDDAPKYYHHAPYKVTK